ncbi:MAG: ZIP family metal transporter [Candidatus Lokiarchaeota archaeon]|nr:ZIP family metal transporter [Candidatus Lokiarchaeota archaeon]MCK4481519.1 ZIP family metal transporter [Candidatus Lokiarchaeota archaeon]
MFLNEKSQKSLIPLLIAFATGVLLTAAFLGLIPEAVEKAGEPHIIMPYILGGILFFFIMEKVVIWRNCRDKTCEVHSNASGPIILLGDSLHNLTDGIVIAAAFLSGLNLGIVAGFTIIFHELAHETGDFGVLLHSGYSKKKAFIYNMVSSSTTIPASIISYFLLDSMEFAVPFLLAISASSFIYIALSDLTPDLHRHTEIKYILKQIAFIIIGIVLMALILSLGGHQH